MHIAVTERAYSGFSRQQKTRLGGQRYSGFTQLPETHQRQQSCHDAQ
jgi:hypothetical protein